MSQHSRVHPRPCSAPGPALCREQSFPSVQMEGQATGPSKHQGEMSPKPGLTGGWSKCWEAHLGDCCPQPQARSLPSADLAALAPWHFPSSPPPLPAPGFRPDRAGRACSTQGLQGSRGAMCCYSSREFGVTHCGRHPLAGVLTLGRLCLWVAGGSLHFPSMLL